MRKQQVCLMLLAICAGSINLAWGMDKKETKNQPEKLYYITKTHTCPVCRTEYGGASKTRILLCCLYLICPGCLADFIEKDIGCFFHKGAIVRRDGFYKKKPLSYSSFKVKCNEIDDPFSDSDKVSKEVQKYFSTKLKGNGKRYTRRKLIIQNYLKHVKDISNTQKENKKDMYVNWYEGLDKYINEELIKK